MHKFISAMVVLFALSLHLVGIGSPIAQGAEPHEIILSSLVYLEATGKVGSSHVESYATGFLVSNDGLVLTTYHLISELGDVDPQSVRIDARIKQKNANVWRAAIVDASINTSLLLLKIPPSSEKYTKVRLGSAQSHNDSDPIYTSGFPKSSSTPRKHDQKIESREGPGGHLWTTGLKFKYGESGSPIYNADGQVIGIVKSDKENQTAYMIPIGFADSLMAQVRLREIQKFLHDFESLRFKMTWSGRLIQASGHSRIVVSYEKMVAGDPQVESVDLLIKPYGIRDGKKELVSELRMKELPRTGLLGTTVGVFELSELWGKINILRETLDFDEITYLKVKIKPKLTDGTPQESKSIVINYVED